MQLELTFADLALIEKRLQRIADETKSMRAAERVAIDRETDLLRRLQTHLGDGGTLLDAPMSDQERADIRHYRFLTERPMLTIINVDETLRQRLLLVEGITLSARLEEELRDFDDDEATATERNSGRRRGAVETGAARDVSVCSACARSSRSVPITKCRGWTVRRGRHRAQAAGKIHHRLNAASDPRRSRALGRICSLVEKQSARRARKLSRKKRASPAPRAKTTKVQGRDVPAHPSSDV